MACFHLRPADTMLLCRWSRDQLTISLYSWHIGQSWSDGAGKCVCVKVWLLPVTEGSLPRQQWRLSSPLSGRGIRRTCAHLVLISSQRSPSHAELLSRLWALPSRHAAHHELCGYWVLLSDGARVVPKYPTPPLVPPSVFCQVHHLVHLIVALGLVLTGCGEESVVFNLTAM